MSSFWSAWIIILTAFSLIAVTWLLFSNRKSKLNAENEAKRAHVYDGIEEYDNPLPAWWFNLFLLTLVFTAIYLIVYPGMGNFKGLLNWTSIKQWQADVDRADEKYAHIYTAYRNTPLPELASNQQARKIGQRIFANNCATCHGSDAGGTIGYPDLTDNDWLYGSKPEQILTSIAQGRTAAMPAWASVLGSGGLQAVTEYVLQLSASNSLQNSNSVQTSATELSSSATQNSIGKEKYLTMCAACHGNTGKGNIALGAPDLTDNIWLYGGKAEDIMQSIANGRNGQMPPHEKLLSEEKIHILAAYVYGLSGNRTISP